MELRAVDLAMLIFVSLYQSNGSKKNAQFPQVSYLCCMGQRLEHMDLLKCFAIFSVLLGHSTEQLSGGLFWDHPVWEFIYSYHMPLFMFVCGFFYLLP